MKLYMPIDKSLNPRQQAAVYYADGFTWPASCELAGYDEQADMREEMITWAYAVAGFSAVCFFVIPSIIEVLS